MTLDCKTCYDFILFGYIRVSTNLRVKLLRFKLPPIQTRQKHKLVYGMQIIVELQVRLMPPNKVLTSQVRPGLTLKLV